MQMYENNTKKLLVSEFLSGKGWSLPPSYLFSLTNESMVLNLAGDLQVVVSLRVNNGSSVI